jgi:hypothetical protein
MSGIGNERKVRCHKEPVENPLARLAAGCDCTRKLKMVADPSVPAFLLDSESLLQEANWFL